MVDRRWLVVLLAALCGCSSDDAASGEAIPPLAPIVRPEHPRPDFRRDTFVNLNTLWDFAYDPDDVGLDESWFERGDVWTDRIQVPYAWEAPLSGLVPPHEGPYTIVDTLRALTYRGVAWYRLRLGDPLPAESGLDWHLVFGAVDFEASVWINGQHAVDHTGGYAPFSVNLAPYVSAGQAVSIVLRVKDETELNNRAQPVGKQGGVWYTRTSGIWQTVYLEQRPAVYLQSIRIVPEPRQARVTVRPTLSNAAGATITLEAKLNGAIVGRAEQSVSEASPALQLPLDEVQTWDSEHPVLYDLDVKVTGTDGMADVVHTYFGLVEIDRDWLPGHSPTDTTESVEQVQSLRVHGRPRYLRCILDQSYYPDGVYTAPSLEAIRADLELAKSFGFNCIRLHIKVDEPIKLRLLDEMGFYVVYDVPSLDMQAKNVEGFVGRTYFEETMRSMFDRDANHPSVVAWVVFNENWGLFENGSMLEPTLLADSLGVRTWVQEMVDLARTLDPTRPIEDNSAGGVVERFEHLDTDLNSFHYYGESAADYRTFLDEQAAVTYPGSPDNYVGGQVQDGDPWWNSEFASFSTLGPSEGAQMYCDLFGLLNEMRRQPKLVGWTLTQLTDVEYEQNGLVAYDRSPKPDLCERAGVGLQDVLGDDFVAFDWLPNQALAAGDSVDVPLLVSLWSSDQATPVRVRLRWDEDAIVEEDVTALPFEATPVAIPMIVPSESGEHLLVAELADGDGKRLAANRLTVQAQ